MKRSLSSAAFCIQDPETASKNQISGVMCFIIGVLKEVRCHMLANISEIPWDIRYLDLLPVESLELLYPR